LRHLIKPFFFFAKERRTRLGSSDATGVRKKTEHVFDRGRLNLEINRTNKGLRLPANRGNKGRKEEDTFRWHRTDSGTIIPPNGRGGGRNGFAVDTADREDSEKEEHEIF